MRSGTGWAYSRGRSVLVTAKCPECGTRHQNTDPKMVLCSEDCRERYGKRMLKLGVKLRKEIDFKPSLEAVMRQNALLRTGNILVWMANVLQGLPAREVKVTG